MGITIFIIGFMLENWFGILHNESVVTMSYVLFYGGAALATIFEFFVLLSKDSQNIVR